MLSKTAAKTFNLLGLGQRGVGKTVFLAGSYAELHAGSQTGYSQQLWLTCQDSRVQENIENILTYVARTGQYPPPTMKITDFNFSLKSHSLWGAQTLCHLRWWDIPGEICDIRNPEFRALVPTSHGCCVFIDAYALIHRSAAYLQTLEEIIQQVIAIATLVSLNHLDYAFALILTKCDLLDPDPISQSRLEESLQPLTNHLKTMETNYQTFYLNIPIVTTNGSSTLRATDAAAPFLWLVWELSKAHSADLMDSSLKVVPYLLPSSFQLRKEPTSSLTQNLQPTSRPSGVKKIPELIGVRGRLLPRTYKYILILAIAGAVGVIGLLLVNYKSTNQYPPAPQEDTR